jgi:aminopeptidase N
VAETRVDKLTEEEARSRAEQISAVAYAIDLDLVAGAKTFSGDVTITFDFRGGDTFLEWLGGEIGSFEINGVAQDPRWDGARITLPAAALGDKNEIRIAYERPYDHTGEGFHQFFDPEDGAEYLYTQFEPYSAHRLFPCFDQPDLKARFRVTVTAPSEWEVVSAGAEIDRDEMPDGRARRVFAETVPFSTYLLAVCAGPFAAVADEHREIPLRLFCRSSLLDHLDAGAIFELTKAGIDFYEQLFDQPYAFGKYDQIFVPEFNWGGMENVAAVTYTDTVVFRDPPTRDQLVRRAEYFMHELAHMWFGDLVTMTWWSDLWLNESFASYAAYLALDDMGEFPSIWQDFNFRMKLWAYREDERPTTHRIADDVASTDETFLNFDGITYGKGASVLKQLVATIGMEAFRSGMHIYFGRHRFGNASLADFLTALQEGSGMDLLQWAARWLKTAGRNSLGVEWESRDGRISQLELVQSAPADFPVLRPHRVDLGLVLADGSLLSVPATIDDRRRVVKEAEAIRAPVFVFPNYGDHGYAKVSLDPASTEWALENVGSITEVLLRQQVWASLWEMTRDRLLSSMDYLALVRRVLVDEPDLAVVQMVTATVVSAVARYVPEELIEKESQALVEAARSAIDSAAPGDMRVLWARTLIDLARSDEDARLAATIVDVPPDGLAVDQDMRWAVAVRWVALGLDGAAERLASEQVRDKSDRGERAMATAQAARPDPEVKEEVWDRIHGGGYDSLKLTLSAARGFWRRCQRDILEHFVSRFFEGLPKVFREWEAEAARSYFGAFFPWYRIDESTLGQVRGLLDDGGDLGPMLKRLLIEAEDDLKRALACRAFAAEAMEQADAEFRPS